MAHWEGGGGIYKPEHSHYILTQYARKIKWDVEQATKKIISQWKLKLASRGFTGGCL